MVVCARLPESSMPVQAGIQGIWLDAVHAGTTSMDPRLRGGDDQGRITTHHLPATP